MTKADRIRAYAKDKIFATTGVKAGDIVEISAREIHDGLALESRFPLVISALSTSKFWEPLGLHPLFEKPVRQSSTTVLRYLKS